MKVLTFRQLRHYWPVYLLVLPAIALVLTFSYFPATSAVYHAFFRWDGDEVSEWIGLDNFRRAFGDPVLGKAFILVMILIVANLLKMVPSVITAVVIHRLASDRARYLYRVAFVIPMIIPAMVWLLVWKYFYDPTVGVLNRVLRAVHLMPALQWLDARMPRLAAWAAPLHEDAINPIFGSVWGLGLLGVLCFALLGGLKGILKGWMWWLIILAAMVAVWHQSFAALAARQDGAVSAVVVLASLAVILAARRTAKGRTALRWAGRGLIVLAALLVVTTRTWTEPTGAFAHGRPSWLGHEKLIVPALILWGFPWVGVVSVLLYLSGLGNIDQSVYDAAEIDGCGWFRKFWNIELPLIMTQVRLNLILMVIGTLKGWGLVFILLGDTGGPGGAGMLPGLYMFRKAFADMEAGYACAIGLLLFALIVFLTLINTRYVRVER